MSARQSPQSDWDHACWIPVCRHRGKFAAMEGFLLALGFRLYWWTFPGGTCTAGSGVARYVGFAAGEQMRMIG